MSDIMLPMNKNFNPNKPIILGLAGKAATGKTSVAEFIVPKGSVNPSVNNVIWEHIFLALPLYELASVKRTIRGLRERDRQLYSLHSVVYDLFGGSPIGNVPNYEDLIKIVMEIYSLKIEPEGVKPRSFLQKAGDICRSFDEDCFSKWAISKSNRLYSNYLSELGQDETQFPFCVIISDVRFANEARWITDQENGLIVCFEASDEVRDKRILNRDGQFMTDEQKSHRSEQEIDLVKEMSSVILNTDNMSIKDQSMATIELINSMVGINA